MALRDAVKEYYTVWLISMGSSVFLLLIAFIVGTLGNEDILLLTVTLFNMTISIFIILTTIPAGIAIIGIIIFYNLFAPITVPVLQWVLNNFGATFFSIVGVPYQSVMIAPQQADVFEAMLAFVNFLNFYKNLLITAIPTR